MSILPPFCNETTTSRLIHANKLSKLQNFLLYSKYSSSQNYYYSNVISSITTNKKDKTNIDFCSWNLTEDVSYLKRYYFKEELTSKISLLCEYYRYHNDIPRFFEKKTSSVVYHYCDKKRRINYNKVIREIEGEGEGDRVAIHDSEGGSIANTEVSINQSLKSFIPKRYKNNPGSSNKKKIDKQNLENISTSSITLLNLNKELDIVLDRTGIEGNIPFRNFKKNPLNAREFISKQHFKIDNEKERNSVFKKEMSKNETGVTLTKNITKPGIGTTKSRDLCFSSVFKSFLRFNANQKKSKSKTGIKK